MVLAPTESITPSIVAQSTPVVEAEHPEDYGSFVAALRYFHDRWQIRQRGADRVVEWRPEVDVLAALWYGGCLVAEARMSKMRRNDV